MKETTISCAIYPKKYANCDISSLTESGSILLLDRVWQLICLQSYPHSHLHQQWLTTRQTLSDMMFQSAVD